MLTPFHLVLTPFHLTKHQLSLIGRKDSWIALLYSCFLVVRHSCQLWLFSVLLFYVFLMFGFETVIEIVIPRSIYTLDFSQKDFGYVVGRHLLHNLSMFWTVLAWICWLYQLVFVCITMLLKTFEQIWFGTGPQFSKLLEWWRKGLISCEKMYPNLLLAPGKRHLNEIRDYSSSLVPLLIAFLWRWIFQRKSWKKILCSL